MRRLSPVLCLAGAAMMVAALPATAAAQRGRRAQPPSVRSSVVVVGGYGYGMYVPWYQYRYPYPYPSPFSPPYPPYPYPYYYTVNEFTASVKLEVQPKDAEVWVDGYLAGKVDDFDGIFQRLRVRPGEHEIVLYFEGYRTVQQRLLLAPNSSQRIKYEMERLGPGESSGPRPEPPPAAELEERTLPPQPRQPRAPQPPPQAPERFGTLSIRVQPADAEILVDGERWDSPAGQARLAVQLAPGRHHVEVHKPGFLTYSEDVLIRPGATLTLNVSLLRTGQRGTER